MKEDLRYFPGWGEPFILELAGMSWCDGSYRIRRTCSPVWVLEQVLEGTGTVEVNGVRHTASAGDVYLLPLGAAHYYYSDPRDPWVKIFMNVRGALPGALISTYGLTGRVVFPAGGLEPLFRDFYDLVSGEGEALQSGASLLFHKICMALGSGGEAGASEPPEAAAMKAYLDQNVSRLVRVQELAETIYRSPDYAGKLFRRTYGVTPYAYLLQRKLELACRLLQSTALPVQEIAARLGYEDAHYFSGLFRRHTGRTPSDFRKNG